MRTVLGFFPRAPDLLFGLPAAGLTAGFSAGSLSSAASSLGASSGLAAASLGSVSAGAGGCTRKVGNARSASGVHCCARSAHGCRAVYYNPIVAGWLTLMVWRGVIFNIFHLSVAPTV